ncbi:hypothetical protein COT12_01535 [Candidatus Berkelbacteria bacterium CG08_land_8_20_14_0_20_39_8]|uniref:Uncharacterized protein n=1 Tax=Candidatus Berkelbacteria bacterium CG08_land_8_20_14_0_20_39_8 TaxID=1974511 RepID=A0A2M6YCC0_9BACT|nr:MAG: hypothetical protein COT12_01535 [Candidatus Berkelbacteria bacterium CG08_land_8_20_14_0_20_39_8]
MVPIAPIIKIMSGISIKMIENMTSLGLTFPECQDLAKVAKSHGIYVKKSFLIIQNLIKDHKFSSSKA